MARMEASRAAMPSPPLQVEQEVAPPAETSSMVTALADFVNEVRPSEAPSRTAHRMREGTSAGGNVQEELLTLLRERGNTVPPTEAAKLELLASDDSMEMQLRRLAAKVHELRTGDRDAAMHMLAISLP